jgi:type IV pilus assembly protein PilA
MVRIDPTTTDSHRSIGTRAALLAPDALMTRPARRDSTTEQGFTLLEMMVVVVIVGVLATLATYSVRNYLASSKVSEAVSMMTGIKSAEEAYKAETFVYLDVSTDFAPGNGYPSTTVGKFKTAWGDTTTPVGKRWNTLGVRADGPVQFAYYVVATAPGANSPSLPTAKTRASFNLPATPDRWQYIAAARGDVGGSPNIYTYVVSHSYSTEVYVENEGE